MIKLFIAHQVDTDNKFKEVYLLGWMTMQMDKLKFKIIMNYKINRFKPKDNLSSDLKLTKQQLIVLSIL